MGCAQRSFFGQVVRVNPTRGFSVADFNALFAHELLLRVDPVAKAIDSFYNDSHVFDRCVLLPSIVVPTNVCLILASPAARPTRTS